jgi:hypothetical protein
MNTLPTAMSPCLTPKNMRRRRPPPIITTLDDGEGLHLPSLSHLNGKYKPEIAFSPSGFCLKWKKVEAEQGSNEQARDNKKLKNMNQNHYGVYLPLMQCKEVLSPMSVCASPLSSSWNNENEIEKELTDLNISGPDLQELFGHDEDVGVAHNNDPDIEQFTVCSPVFESNLYLLASSAESFSSTRPHVPRRQVCIQDLCTGQHGF